MPVSIQYNSKDCEFSKEDELIFMKVCHEYQNMLYKKACLNLGFPVSEPDYSNTLIIDAKLCQTKDNDDYINIPYMDEEGTFKKYSHAYGLTGWKTVNPAHFDKKTGCAIPLNKRK